MAFNSNVTISPVMSSTLMVVVTSARTYFPVNLEDPCAVRVIGTFLKLSRDGVSVVKRLSQKSPLPFARPLRNFRCWDLRV